MRARSRGAGTLKRNLSYGVIPHGPRRADAALAVRIAALVALLFFQLLWARQPLPPWLKGLPFLLTALSIWRPWIGLVCFAAVAPFKGPIWDALSGSASGDLRLPTALIGTGLVGQMAIAVLVGAAWRWQANGPRLRLAGPALLFGAVALTSAVVVLPARLFAATPERGTFELLRLLWDGQDLSLLPEWRPLVFALYVIEGLGLACVAERSVREVPERAWQLLATSVAAHAGMGLVALATFLRIISEGATDSALPVSLLRVSALTDPNATGAVFVLTIIASIALVRLRTVRLLSVGAVVVLSLAALWIAGSRTAFLVLGITLFAACATKWWPNASRGRRLTFGIALAMIVIANVATVFYLPYRSRTTSFVAETRWITARAGLRMARTAPLFGVGIGTFWDRSVEFGTGDMLPLAREADVRQYDAHENAHNNFIQILAEQGLIGLLALGVVLGSVLQPASARAVRTRRTLWLLAGVGGFILTWFGGHPLLVPEAAFVFWLFFGVLAGLTPAPDDPRVPRRWLWIAIAILAASIPFRLVAESKIADFSHVGVGVSPWTKDSSGSEYRTAGSHFSLYVPANKFVVVTVRRAPDIQGPQRIEIRSAERLVNAVTVDSNAWTEIKLFQSAKGRRFVRVDFSVSGDRAATSPEVLWVRPDQSRTQ